MNPRHPEIAPREEHGDALPCEKVRPALLTNLPHDGVDPGEAGATLAPTAQVVLVLVPRQLDAERVAVHRIEHWRGQPHKESELAQEEVLGELLKERLAARGGRGKLPQLTEKLADRQAPKPDIRAERVLAHEPADGFSLRENALGAEAGQTTQRLSLPADP